MVLLINWVFWAHVRYVFLFNSDYILRNVLGTWKIRAWSDHDYIVSPVFEASLQKYFLTNAEIFIDIWAHVGKWSVFVGKHQPNTRIYAFEANKETFAYLQENLSLNWVKNASALNIGISSHSGTLNFESSKDISAVSKISTSNSSECSIITVTSIDTFLSGKLSGSEKTLVKIDVEWHEGAVLQWMENLLAQSTSTSVLCEILSEESYSRIIPYMKSLGYSFEKLATWYDYLFTK
jgi:FkbM family methyltransferase